MTDVNTAHTARAHAKLAPSAAHRWVECPGSIQMSEGIPNKSSVFAAEGTAAHELCAHCLETNDHPETFLDMWIDIEAADGKSRFVSLDDAPTGEDAMRFFLVDEEMADSVRLYVEHIRGLITHEDCILSVEERLDMTHIDPRIFGTGDATVLDMKAKHLHVIDFKYGKGVAVDADRNPQLMLYAAGAARRHHNHDIARLTVHIVQPRAYHLAGPIRQFDLDLIELMEFEFEIEDAAKKVNAATETYEVAVTDEWKNQHLNAGEWCRFCPAQPICPKRREQVVADAIAEFGEDGNLILMEPTDMNHDQLAKVLRNADSLNTYVKAVQQHAHSLAMNGTRLPGLKLVAKRATRKWKDEEAAQEFLEVLGVAKDQMFDEPKFKTPAKMESFFPGKNKDQRQQAMAELVKKESSGCNLVPAEDPRPEVVIGATSDFEEVDVG
jgi:hypothetical protein